MSNPVASGLPVIIREYYAAVSGFVLLLRPISKPPLARTIRPSLFVIWAGGFETSLVTRQSDLDVVVSAMELMAHIPDDTVTLSSFPHYAGARV